MKLKPCPFCGEKPQHWKNDDGYHRYGCINNSCRVYVYTYAQTTAKQAMREWNTRKGEK